MDEKMVEITEKEYDSLVGDSYWLSYLEAAGVDNWNGYSEAQDMRDEEEGND